MLKTFLETYIKNFCKMNLILIHIILKCMSWQNVHLLSLFMCLLVKIWATSPFGHLAALSPEALSY